MTLHQLEGNRMMGVAFTEFDRNPKFVPDDILLNFVARSKNHGNCSPCRMNLYKVLFIL